LGQTSQDYFGLLNGMLDNIYEAIASFTHQFLPAPIIFQNYENCPYHFLFQEKRRRAPMEEMFPVIGFLKRVRDSGMCFWDEE